jgi:hypothetical protein
LGLLGWHSLGATSLLFGRSCLSCSTLFASTWTEIARHTGSSVLGSFVRVLQAIERRNRGEAIESPRVIEPEHNVAVGSTLSAALGGWKKAKQPSRTVVRSRGQAVIGISNSTRLFHSFRHSFKDALRTAGVSEDVIDVLTGHSGGGVGRTYGAMEMVRRNKATGRCSFEGGIPRIGPLTSPRHKGEPLGSR